MLHAHSRITPNKTHLCLNMSKVDPKLLEQGRLAVVPFSRKGRQPTRAQTALLAHATRHTDAAARRSTESRRAAEATCRGGLGSVAVRGLLWGCVARDGAGWGVGGGVELEVLGTSSSSAAAASCAGAVGLLGLVVV